MKKGIVKIEVAPRGFEKTINPKFKNKFVTGAEIIIDYKNNRIGSHWYGAKEPREWYSLNDEWLQKFKTCRVCGKKVDDERLAFAYWKLQQGVCSLKCLRAEELKRYACCPKAKQVFCVCHYSTTCPDHGQRCHGTHD